MAGRLRKSVGAAMLVVGAAVVISAVASRWISLTRSSGPPGWFIVVERGFIRVAYWSSMGGLGPRPAAWEVRRRSPASGPELVSPGVGSILGLVEVERRNGFGMVGSLVTVHPMVPAMVAMVAGGVLHRWGRRAAAAKLDGCPKCGYAVQGLAPGSRCPECGNDNSDAQGTHPVS